MAGLSAYAESAVINALFRGTNFTAPAVANLHLALFTADPTNLGTLNELPAGSWYVRQLTGTFAAPAPNGTAQVTSNTSSITFPAVTGSAVTVAFIGIFDNTTAGNMLVSAPMTSAKTLQIGDVLSFAPGTITISVD